MTMASTDATRISSLERLLLVIPLLGGAVFGLFPLLAPAQFAALAGGTGNDPYIYRLAGAATVGYAVALAPALLQQSWARAHLLVIAILTFNVASLFACGVELASGDTKPVIVLILGASIIIVAITSWLLYIHRAAPPPVADIGAWVVRFLILATALAALAGLIALLLPVQFGTFFDFRATDIFTYRQGGAAVLGYGALGLAELRSRAWSEIRSAAIMAGVFNALAALVSLITIAVGQGSLLVYIIGAASLGVTVATAIEIRRRGM